MRALGGGLLLAVLLLGACARPATYPPPSTALERGIYLAERARGSRLHGISRADPTETDDTVERVASPFPVDWNSTIEIRVLADALLADTAPPDREGQIQALTQKQRTLTDALRHLAEYLEGRTVAIDAYWHLKGLGTADPGRKAARKAFIAARRTSAQAENHFIEALLTLYPSGAQRTQIEGLGRHLADLAPYLNDKLAQAQTDHRRLVSKLGYQLRLEALLQSPDKEPHKVHLPGYDNVDVGEFETRDRFGLRLSAGEQERFDELSRQTRVLAAAGNRVLDAETSLQESFAALSDTVLAPVASYAEKVEAYAQKLRGVDQLVAKTQAALEALAQEFEEGLREAGRDQVDAFLQGWISAGPALGGQQGRLANLQALLVTTATLRELIQKFDSAGDVPVLLATANAARTRVQSLTVDLEAAQELIRGLRNQFEQSLDSLGEDLHARAREIWDASQAKTSVDTWTGLYEEGLELFEDGKDLFARDFLPPLPLEGLLVPEAFDVPLEDTTNTRIELARSPRLDGDRVTLRATLLDGQDPLAQREFQFDVRRMGWYGRLDPTVALAKPDQGPPGVDYRFVPAVSWLWTYSPRPDEDGSVDQLFRFSRFSTGPHATFLNFVAEKELEVGLGMTVGLWNGVLQAGVGWNLMADRKDEGVYYFIGSSLIPLLQQFGAAAPAAGQM